MASGDVDAWSRVGGTAEPIVATALSVILAAAEGVVQMKEGRNAVREAATACGLEPTCHELRVRTGTCFL